MCRVGILRLVVTVLLPSHIPLGTSCPFTMLAPNYGYKPQPSRKITASHSAVK